MSILFPNVPNVPGVPPILRAPGNTVAFPAIMIADTVAGALGLASNQWGIYDQNNALVVTPDSVVAVEYRHDWHVSDYPIEEGGFVSYNKVQVPFDTRVTLSKGGMDSDRAVFLSALEAAAASLNLYSIIMPEYKFLNVNIMHLDYRRTSRNGVGLILADIWLREIRIATTVQFTATPSGADAVNIGTVQTTTPTAAEAFFGLNTGEGGNWQ
jgi:hypothetical protein